MEWYGVNWVKKHGKEAWKTGKEESSPARLDESGEPDNQVPISQELRYSFCSSVNSSISMPMVCNFRREM